MTSGPDPTQAFLTRQRDVLERIACGAPLPEVLERIVRLVEEQAPGMACSILLVDPEQRRVRLGAAPSLPAELNHGIDGALIGPEEGSCGAAAHRGERVIVEDIAAHPHWAAYRHLALPHGLRACWSSPIFSPRRQVLGTFAMYYREPRGPEAREIEWVDAATHLAAIAIGHEAGEQALRRGEARYRRIVDTAREGIWLVDTAGRTLFANRRLAAMLGRAQDEMSGLPIADLIDEAAWRDLAPRLARPEADEGEPRDVLLRRGTGVDLWAIVSVSSVRDDAGVPVGSLLMVTDITERKRAEDRLQQMARLYAVSSAVNEAIVRVRDAGELYEQACRIAVERGRLRLAWVGVYDAERGILTPAARFGADDGYVGSITIGPEDPRMNQGPAARALHTGAHAVDDDIAESPHFYWKAEALARGLRSCAAFPLTIRGAAIGVLLLYADRPGFFGDEEIGVLGALADDIAFAVESAGNEVDRQRLVHDLGERVKELTLLHRTASLLQTDRPCDAAFLADLVSPVPLGWQHADVCEARIACGEVEARTPGWRETPWKQSATFTVGGRPGVIEVVYLAERPAAAEGPFLSEERALLQSLADMLRAHFERQYTQAAMRESEERLWRAQRIQSLGTLAGGIAHDFNNVLAAVAGNADLAAEKLPREHPVQRNLERIRQASGRATDLVRRILTFSRQQEPRRSVVRLQPLVEEVLKLLAATLPATIEIRTHFDPGAPSALADATQIHQVLMNLGTNAAHAMGEGGGHLEIRLDTATLGRQAAAMSPDLREGRYVRLTVRDSGSGMDAATLEHAFEPFFTTKAPGHGTGLGLSVVHGIMKSHEGAVTVESAPGLGTTFSLYFPAAGGGPVESPPAPPADVRGGGEHLLFVDDEEPVVYVATQVLQRLGYRVTASTDAVQALGVFRSSPQEFAAVVTDVSMPVLGGIELARRMREIRPDLPLVFTSGHVRADEAEAIGRLGPTDVIPKPSLVAELGPALHRLLAPRAGIPPS